MKQINEGFNKIKWSSSPSEWKNKWIRLTVKTRKKEKHRNAFAHNEWWMTNDEGWMTNEGRMTNDEWWMTNYECWRINDKWWWINVKCWMMNTKFITYYDNNTVLWMVG